MEITATSTCDICPYWHRSYSRCGLNRCIYEEYTKSQNPEASTSNDIIAHPAHYTEGREYEPKDVIYDWGLDFNLGSAVKYISRAGRKDDIVQDLKKAIQFIQFEIDAIEKKKIKENE